MSQENNLADQLFGHGQQQQPMGALQALKEAFLAIAPGLKTMGPEIGAELKHMASMGAHEMAAALFNGSAFVMYPRGTREDHGVHGPEGQEQAAPQPDQHQEQQLERGGRSM
jgi:hypothetical protein